MSPSRTRRPPTRARSRREIVTAVVVCAAIVGGTLLLIWLLRPSDPSVTGSGGLMTRQPRMSLLVFGALIIGIGVLWWINRRRHHWRGRITARSATAFAIVIMLVLAGLAGFFWPGGVIHHWPPQPKPVTVPSTTATSASSTTTTSASSATTTATTKPAATSTTRSP